MAFVGVFGVTVMGSAQTAPSSGLLERAIPFRSGQAGAESFDDLAPLRDVLQGRRVVVLGEATHGEGSTFLVKTRIVKYLHQELGFDVLAFETGMFDAREAWDALRRGEPAREALQRGLVPFWSESRQLAGLGEYLAAEAPGPRPLELVGLDTHVAAVARGDETFAALATGLSRLNALAGDLGASESDLAELSLLRSPKGRTAGRVAGALRALNSIRDVLFKPALIAAVGTEESAWWRQLVRTLTHKLRAVDGIDPDAWAPGRPMAPVFNPRDEQLGENLLWLARERYPSRRIIVWCASMHGVRRPELLSAVGEEGIDYAGVVPMGHHAAVALGQELYVLGFVTAGGETHLPWMPSSTIDKAPEGSFERRALDAGLESVWVDLASAPAESWLRGDFVARPLGHVPMAGPWRHVLDGFFFERTATPSEPYPKSP